MTYTAVIGPLVIGTITTLAGCNPYVAIINAVEVSKVNPNNGSIRFVEYFADLDIAKEWVISFFRPDTHQFITWSQK